MLAVIPRLPPDLRRAIRRLVADPDLPGFGSWRGGTSRSASPATAATSCSAATTGTSGAEISGKGLAGCPGRWRASRQMRSPLSRRATGTRCFAPCEPVLPAAARQRNPGDKLHKLAEILAVDSPETMYLGLASHWKDPGSVVLRGSEPPTALTARNRWARLDDFTLRMMYLDTVTYLPDDILVKVDRASMAVSLEVRVPLLDPRVVEFAWQVPLAMKVRDGTGKWLLRQVLYRYVPAALIERPKMGFGGPLDSWLRGPLRDWGEELLAERRLREEGHFEPAPIREKWQEHQAGTRNWQYYLWDVLMFQAWLEHQQAAVV